MSEQGPIQEQSLTVSGLALQLTHALQGAFPTTVWLDAELSNFKAYPSGHWYFSVTDGQASLSAVMFKGHNRLVRLVARDGLQVRIECEVNFYPPNGKLQLIVKKMAEAGLGDQKAKLDALRAKLIAEGLTDASRKKSLPVMPMCIGLITSAKGAVISDMLTVLARRWPLAHIRLYSAAVQGESAALELRTALQRAVADRACEVLIIGRGGGSADDFSAFNDEALVREVAACPIPIVSAVGHETDTGLTDLVADVRAATPSQAAEMVSPDAADIAHRVDGLLHRLASRTETQVSLAQQRVELVIQRLGQHTEQLTQRRRDTVSRLAARLMAPTDYIAAKRGDLSALQHRLHSRMDSLSHRRQATLGQLTAQLDVLSPLATLSRGYGIVLKAGASTDRTLGSVNDTAPGDPIEIRLKDGRLDAEIIAVQRGDA